MLRIPQCNQKNMPIPAAPSQPNGGPPCHLNMHNVGDGETTATHEILSIKKKSNEFVLINSYFSVFFPQQT